MSWQGEFDRLNLHRQIIQGKLAIPSNRATKASLQAHLARIEGQLGKHIHAAMPKPEPWETAKALRDEKKRFGKGWSRIRKIEYKERLADLRYEQECKDEGVKPYKWVPPTPWPPSQESIEETKRQVQAIIDKYARVPA